MDKINKEVTEVTSEEKSNPETEMFAYDFRVKLENGEDLKFRVPSNVIMMDSPLKGYKSANGTRPMLDITNRLVYSPVDKVILRRLLICCGISLIVGLLIGAGVMFAVGKVSPIFDQDPAAAASVTETVEEETMQDGDAKTAEVKEVKAEEKPAETKADTAKAVEKPVEKELKIKATPNRIKADGSEEAVFTVLYGEDDVTAEAVVYNTSTNEEITSKKFSSTTVGSYTFRARYDGKTTGVSATVEVYDPALAGKYEIGSIYEINGVKGVIYAIKTDNKGITWCYLFSMDEEDLQWSTVYEWCNCISDKGAWNTYDPFTYYGMDINNYPAFKWCMDHGDGWFMPSSLELQWMWDAVSGGTHRFDSESVAQYNKLLTDNGGMPFVETYYWSSNETAADVVELIAFMNDSVVCLDPQKTNTYTVRAAYRFPLE